MSGSARPSSGPSSRPPTAFRSPSSHGARPSNTVRPGRSASSGTYRATPSYRSTRDHRYARPSPRHVRPYPRAYGGVPRSYWYRPYYTRWWVHPWYRHQYMTSVVMGFGFATYAWDPLWMPPTRAGFMWVNGRHVGGMWWPGYWSPMAPVPVGFVYVNGFWHNDAYVEGFYRPEQRDDGDWTWVDGYYLEDGTHIRGHWRPAKQGPEGYTWEPGFWDGETWVDGFWRPEFRRGFTWVSSYYDADGIFHTGYWAPLEQLPGKTWIPGWFDGNQWVKGYWVDSDEFESADLSDWQPDEGWDAGWDDAAAEPGPQAEGDRPVLGLPVALPDDED